MPADALHERTRGRQRFTQLSRRKLGLCDALPCDLLLVRPVGSPQFGPVDLAHRSCRRDYAICPWQCLYFLPEPHGHGALRLTGASTTPPCASPRGSGCCGMIPNGTLDSTAPVAASMSAVSSSPEKGSMCWVMKSGKAGGGAGSSWT